METSAIYLFSCFINNNYNKQIIIKMKDKTNDYFTNGIIKSKHIGSNFIFNIFYFRILFKFHF